MSEKECVRRENISSIIHANDPASMVKGVIAYSDLLEGKTKEEFQVYLMLEGTKGGILLTLGLILEYPEGRPYKLEYLTYNMDDWKEKELVGGWFLEIFIGSMGGLLAELEDPDFHYLNSVEDAYITMCVVEAC